MSARERTIEELVAELVLRLEQEPDCDLDLLLAEHGEHASELRRRIEILRAAGLLARPANGARLTDPLEPIRQRLERRGDFPLRYALAGELGRGGMGRILEAREDDLQRTVAMKVFHPRDGNGAPDPALVGRFLHEARITAQLDHPGIVPVHELGLDDQGQLYFTMRMVSGEDLRQIYEHVATGHDGWNQPRALGVLLKVCEALGYAHEKRVIHRDLKPANVMVGKHGEVYVMDWGLARVLGQHDPFDLRIRPEAEADPSDTPGVTPAGTLAQPAQTRAPPAETPPDQAGREHASDSPLVTRNGDIVGTPAYMPPEQARGNLAALGPQSDVYAVGAMLYHLVAGRMPFVAVGTRPSPRAILRRVLEGPPAALAGLAPNAPPELIAICEKAMAREPTQRYANTTEFAEDLRAFLELRMVRAYRTGPWIEAKKWVQRNKPLALALLGVVLALTIGAVAFKLKADEATRTAAFATLESRRADAKAEESEANAEKARDEAKRADEQRQIAIEQSQRADRNAADAAQNAQEARNQATSAETARKLAETRAEETKQVADFEDEMLQGLVLEQFGHRMVVELGRALREELERRGMAEADVSRALEALDQDLAPANASTAAGRILEDQILERHAAQAEKQFASQPVVAAQLLLAIGVSESELGLTGASERNVRKALEIQTRELGPGAPETLETMQVLGSLLNRTELADEATRLCRAAVDGCRKHLGNRSQTTLASIGALAEVLFCQGVLPEAEELAVEAEQGLRETLGNQARNTLMVIATHAAILLAEQRFEEAEPLYREVVEGHRQRAGDDDSSTVDALGELARFLQVSGRPREAEQPARRALAGLRKTLGNDHATTLYAMGTLGEILANAGKLSECEELLREMIAGLTRHVGEYSLTAAQQVRNLCELLIREGKSAEAESLCLEWLPWARQAGGERHRTVLALEQSLAFAYRNNGKLEEGERTARSTLSALRSEFGNENLQTVTTIAVLASILVQKKQYDEAAALATERVAILRHMLGDKHPGLQGALNDLGFILTSVGRHVEAERAIREAVTIGREALGDGHTQTLLGIGQLVPVLRIQGKAAEAEPLAREAFEGFRASAGKDHAQTLQAEIRLVEVLAELGKSAEAEPLAREAYEIYRQQFGLNDSRTLWALYELGLQLEGLSKNEEAIAAFRQVFEACQKELGEDHSSTMAAMDHLTLALASCGQFVEASTLGREDLKRTTKNSGADTPATKCAAKRLAEALDRWEVVDPGKGHGEEAAALRRAHKL